MPAKPIKEINLKTLEKEIQRRYKEQNVKRLEEQKLQFEEQQKKNAEVHKERFEVFKKEVSKFNVYELIVPMKITVFAENEKKAREAAVGALDDDVGVDYMGCKHNRVLALKRTPHIKKCVDFDIKNKTNFYADYAVYDSWDRVFGYSSPKLCFDHIESIYDLGSLRKNLDEIFKEKK